MIEKIVVIVWLALSTLSCYAAPSVYLTSFIIKNSCKIDAIVEVKKDVFITPFTDTKNINAEEVMQLSQGQTSSAGAVISFSKKFDKHRISFVDSNYQLIIRISDHIYQLSSKEIINNSNYFKENNQLILDTKTYCPKFE